MAFSRLGAGLDEEPADNFVDHIGLADTRCVTGGFSECDFVPLPIEHMPQIRPSD
jgi:hypothetical protein